MRFVALALLLLAIPLLYATLQATPRYKRELWIAVGLLPFVISAWHLDASIISWAMWPGYVKGMIISLLDVVAIVVLIMAPRQKLKTPFAGLIVAYAAAVVVATFNADPKMASFFYFWVLCRMLLVFFAVSRIASQPKGIQYIGYGLATGVLLQAFFAINQKLHGVAQASGTMAHQNSLGMATHFVLFPCLALLLAGRREKITTFGFLAAIICVVLTGSRATIGLAAAGIVIMLLLSFAMRATPRKGQIIGMGVVVLLAASPVAYAGLSKRLSAESIASSDSERTAFKRAAWMIIDDHPFGVGANEYVITANVGGYSERAGVAWNGGSRAANVHNTYLLMTAEIGYIGAAIYIALMLIPVMMLMTFAWRNKRSFNGELALGFAMALAVVAAHCLYEWIYVTDPIIYLHAICLGMGAGLFRQKQLLERQSYRSRR